MATNRDRITNLQQDLSEVRDTIDDIEESLVSITTKIANINNDLEEKEEAAESIVEKMSNLSEQLKGFADTIEENKNFSAEHKEEMISIKEELYELRDDLNSKINAVNVKNDELEKFFISVFGEEGDEGRTDGIKDRLSKIENDMREYAEGKKKEHDDLLEEQEQRHNNMFGDIEKLLTGATSVGLARAFREQKEGYTPRFERTLGFKGFQFILRQIIIFGRLFL